MGITQCKRIIEVRSVEIQTEPIIRFETLPPPPLTKSLSQIINNVSKNMDDNVSQEILEIPLVYRSFQGYHDRPTKVDVLSPPQVTGEFPNPSPNGSQRTLKSILKQKGNKILSRRKFSQESPEVKRVQFDQGDKWIKYRF